MIDLELTGRDVRKRLLYESYVKAHLEINQYSVQPTSIKSYSFFEDDQVRMVTIDIIPLLFQAIGTLDKPNDDFDSIIDNILANISGHSYMLNTFWVFHFGLLQDYLYLFDIDEQKSWVERMDGLIQEMGRPTISNFEDFYNSYFRTQFFGGDKPPYSNFLDEMKFTYIYHEDYDYDDMGANDFRVPYMGFGPTDFSRIVDFGREYYKFYEDLTAEILKRKGTGQIA